MTATIDAVGSFRARLGEGVYWSDQEQAVFWVDIKGQKVFRYDPLSGEEQFWSVTETIGCLVDNPAGEDFLAAMQSGFTHIRLPEDCSEAETTAIADPESDIPGNRFNDGAIDPIGCFWAGTMDDAERRASGCWWRFDSGGNAHQVLSGFAVTNGPAFSPDGEQVYLTDSPKRVIFGGDFDPGEGVVNLAEWTEFHEDQGFPDGMSFGPDGFLWVAFWDGACIRALDGQGQVVRQIDMPVQRPTKIAFAPDGRAYVSSAMTDGDDGLNGRLFVVDGL